MWEFMEKCVLPALMTSNEKPSGADDTSIPERNVLYDYLHELFVSLKETAIREV